MKVNTLINYFDENDVDEETLSSLGVRNVNPHSNKKWANKNIIRLDQADIHVEHSSDLELIESGFEFSYTPARHEASWLFSAIGQFYQDQWFHDVLRNTKGGKEASVYLCEANPHVEVPFLAAKVYRPRQFRNLRKDFIYREGRDMLDGEGHTITDRGTLHAIHKKTNIGKQFLHSSWMDHEVQTLKTMNRVGGDVPKMFASSEMAILMEFIGDVSMSAPTLQEVSLMSHEAVPLFERTIYNIELMLENKIIHGDLSAYNILYWEGRIVLIDFPQVISPVQNPNAYKIFQRDVQRVCDYFTKQGVRCNGIELAEKIWRKFNYPETAMVPTWLLKAEEDREEDDTDEFD
jgi:RIO kinase 1